MIEVNYIELRTGLKRFLGTVEQNNETLIM